jgi:AraC-like DNA-binding protein
MAGIPNNICEIHSVGADTRERIFGVHGVPSLAAFGIRLAGISETAFGFSWSRTHPVDAQLLASLEGEGECLVGGEWRRLRPGEAYLTPPGVAHAYRAVRGQPWTVGWVIYDAKASALAGLLPREPRIVPVMGAQLRHSIEGAWDAVVGQLPQPQIELWGQIVHFSVLQTLRANQHSGNRLVALWSAVNADLARPWTLGELARAASMSKENLRRVCLKENGTSPLNHVLRLRMRRAAELLLVSDEKLVSIAERVGYGDPFAFSTAFKRETGTSPSEYRKANAKD